MIRTGWLAALVVALAPLPCFGQGGGYGAAPFSEWTVKVETFGNQAVTGKLMLASVAVQCELGTYEIKPEKIKAIEFDAVEAGTPLIYSQLGAQRKGSVITATGQKVVGIIYVPQTWKVETDLGSLTPDAQQLKTLTFVPKVAAVSRQPGGEKPKSDKPGETDPTGLEKKS